MSALRNEWFIWSANSARKKILTFIIILIVPFKSRLEVKPEFSLDLLEPLWCSADDIMFDT